MKQTLLILLAAVLHGVLFTRRRLIGCANIQSKLATENATAEAATFNVLQPDGFFVPYGDYPHKNGLQKFDREAAQKMADHFGSLLSRVANAIAGPAVYIGHPDVPGRGTEFTDKKAYGRITAIEPREDGCHFAAKMNKEGAELIANSSFAYYSPFWGCEKISGGIRPVQLYSIGLTNTPNIDVPALANDEGAADEKKCPDCGGEMKPMEKYECPACAAKSKPAENTLITALITAGIAAENDDEAAILNKITAHIANVDAAALTDLNTQITAANDTLAKAQTDISAANEALKAARTLAANSALDVAITTGRLTPADREAKFDELIALENSADFTASLTGIIAAPATMKTENSHSASLGKDAKSITAANEAAEKSKARTALVEKCKKKFPRLTGQMLHDAAWNSARAEQPGLFS